MLTSTNISCYDARDIESLPDNTVVISINEEYEELHELKLDRLSSKVLTVRFSDVTANRMYGDVEVHPIQPSVVLEILNFININKNKNFIVHCAAGVSRSAAICLYLNIMYGHKLKEDYWKKSRPNKFVLGALMIGRLQPV